MAYVDDLNAVVPYKDCFFYCSEFKRLANNMGLRINTEKSKIMTSTNNISPLNFMSKRRRENLQSCLKKFVESKETVDGMKVLGYPIGSIDYIDKILEDTHKKVTSTYEQIKSKLTDKQTIGQLVGGLCIIVRLSLVMYLSTSILIVWWIKLAPPLMPIA